MGTRERSAYLRVGWHGGAAPLQSERADGFDIDGESLSGEWAESTAELAKDDSDGTRT